MLSVGHGIGSLMPFSLHAPRHIGMEEVGWWGDPRRWDYRHASMRRQAWRRLGGGETHMRGVYTLKAVRGSTLRKCRTSLALSKLLSWSIALLEVKAQTVQPQCFLRRSHYACGWSGPAIDVLFSGQTLSFQAALVQNGLWRLHVISGSWFGSLMPCSLHAPRHIGMEEVGWWGDPRRWDYRHASMRRQAWRRLGGGETHVRGLYSRSHTRQWSIFFFL